MFNFLSSFFRHRKYKNMIRVSAFRILEEISGIVVDAVNKLEQRGRIKTSLHKEVLKFESTALIFWLFRTSGTFPEPLHKMILDAIHDQYYSRLKKGGYDSSAVQVVCDDFNLRYKTYDKLMSDSGDVTKIGTSFAKFVSERAKTDLDAAEIIIPAQLINLAAPKFEEFRQVAKV